MAGHDEDPPEGITRGMTLYYDKRMPSVLLGRVCEKLGRGPHAGRILRSLSPWYVFASDASEIRAAVHDRGELQPADAVGQNLDGALRLEPAGRYDQRVRATQRGDGRQHEGLRVVTRRGTGGPDCDSQRDAREALPPHAPNEGPRGG